MEGEQMFQSGPQPALPPQQPQQPPQQQQLQPRYQQPTEPMNALQPSAAALTSMEQSIHKSIRVAQEVADEVRLNAKKEAELIVQEAEKNADRIINEALQKARAVHSELLDLKQKATVYRARFRTLVQSHLDILENSDWESLEELESNLEETGKQLEQYADRTQTPELLMDHQQTQEFRNQEYHNQEYHNQEYRNMEDPNMIDEVAASYMEEEDEPRRELRRTSRKLKKKAMF
ncbi:DivIVA domain-containing protein [Paenactinomyces guangxiensis]|uniref:DivIVA domain-containing protein n=2 Tax=Paenactinomyces guangxiensis TaxID=1490290 RepID=A0A7W1WQK0_9BACL|nr:DivIVA domain-containing protein [Paenactinomyces guangxiensis]MBA4494230.1 DivIVA domain-containing protein [Paenactinomyces guangxiensis]MBH8590726.1 DivIVA domain-containing protein [Paenactinomyces guangxiensis]